MKISWPPFVWRERRPRPKKGKASSTRDSETTSSGGSVLSPAASHPLIRSPIRRRGRRNRLCSSRLGPSSPSPTLLLRPPSPRSGELSPLGPTFSDDIHGTDILDSLRTSTPPCPANAVPRPSPGAALPRQARATPGRATYVLSSSPSERRLVAPWRPTQRGPLPALVPLLFDVCPR